MQFQPLGMDVGCEMLGCVIVDGKRARARGHSGPCLNWLGISLIVSIRLWVSLLSFAPCKTVDHLPNFSYYFFIVVFVWNYGGAVF